MNKTNQFSPKAQYITPSCRTVMLQARDVILQGSFGDAGRAGGQGRYDDETEGEDY